MSSRNEDLKRKLLATFRGEAEEHLQAITTDLLALDGGLPSTQAGQRLETTFRSVHTLKGAARSVSLTEIEEICQAAESILSKVKHGEIDFTRPVFEALREAADGVALLLAGTGGGAATRDLIRRIDRAAGSGGAAGSSVEAHAEPSRAEAASPPAATPALPSSDTVRLDTARLDALLLRAEDLLISKLAAEERVQEGSSLVETLAVGRAARRRLTGARNLARFRTDEDGRAGSPEAELRSVEARARALLDHLMADRRAIASAADGLLDELRRARMTSATRVLEIFPAMVASLAAEQGKDVAWSIQGGEMELDRKVLEAVKDPLIHLVRNALDHGIESPEERLRIGKPARGQVGVTLAPLEGGRIEIRVQDDGRGIDAAQVKAAAVRARLLTPEEAQALPEAETINLVFRSGLSTASIITHVSGRGLGMAIVKDGAERLGGQVRVKSRPGEGTTVRLILPTTIATSRGLLVRERKRQFLFPSEAIERVIMVARDSIRSVEGRDAIRHDGQPLFIARLGDLLDLPALEEGSREPRSGHACVVLAGGVDGGGILVEEILGDREVLVKDLRAPLVRVRNIAGVGILGTGRGVLILRPSDLLGGIRKARRGQPSAAGPEKEARRPVVLVVDDSITTRMMEKNILETAGYQVRIAADGMEAWAALKSEPFDLVVSDVDMPRLDGFGLTSKVRADADLADLPVVLVTALESREDKEKGIEVGANAYVIKSSFDQSNLLAIISRLV